MSESSVSESQVRECLKNVNDPEISRSLVELHGGVLTVISRPGEGSTFTFTLPLGPSSLPNVASPVLTASSLPVPAG